MGELHANSAIPFMATRTMPIQKHISNTTLRIAWGRWYSLVNTTKSPWNFSEALHTVNDEVGRCAQVLTNGFVPLHVAVLWSENREQHCVVYKVAFCIAQDFQDTLHELYSVHLLSGSISLSSVMI